MSKLKKIDYEKVNRLLLLRDAFDTKGKTQDEVAVFLGVSRKTVSNWLDSSSPAKQERREQFIKLLADFLALDHQTFYKIWNEVMVSVWNWDPLTEDEIKHLNLEPPLALFLNVPPRPLNIPKLVGRNVLLSDLKDRLRNDKRIALMGKPGVGKTNLAVELTHDRDIMEQFPDGIIWVRMGRQPTIMSELLSIAERFGIKIKQDESTDELMLSKKINGDIGRRHFLFVIDDVWDTWRENVEDYLTFDGPNCRTILTTRDQNVARMLAGASRVVSVPELEYETEENPAYELLKDLAPEACAADPATAKYLVTRVGGLPLALVVLGGYLSDPQHSYFSELSEKALAEMKDPLTRLQAVSKWFGDVNKRKMTLQALIEL